MTSTDTPRGLPGQLLGAILLEQSDEWATERSRCMTLEGISSISDAGPAKLSAMPA